MEKATDYQENDKREKDIVFSRGVKAGKRIYYLDVKKTSNGEIYLSITESKKVTQGEGDNIKFTFEKHKIFLYQEDLEKFMDALYEVTNFIETNR